MLHLDDWHGELLPINHQNTKLQVPMETELPEDSDNAIHNTLLLGP